MRTYKLYFIRHGVTEANELGIYCGSTDSPLSEGGTSQLDELLDSRVYPYVERVYSSPLSRAVSTAEILYPAQDIVTVEGLRETSFGEFEGRTLEELKKDPHFREWAAPAGQYVPKDAEDPKEFFRRCCETVVAITEQMMREGTHSAAIVTHAGVIANVLAGLAYPKASPYEWRCEPGCGWCAVADPTLFMRDPVLEVVSAVPASAEDEDDGYREEDSFTEFDSEE